MMKKKKVKGVFNLFFCFDCNLWKYVVLDCSWFISIKKLNIYIILYVWDNFWWCYNNFHKVKFTIWVLIWHQYKFCYNLENKISVYWYKTFLSIYFDFFYFRWHWWWQCWNGEFCLLLRNVNILYHEFQIFGLYETLITNKLGNNFLVPFWNKPTIINPFDSEMV